MKKKAKKGCDSDVSNSLLDGGVNQESISSMEPQKTPVESSVENADGLDSNLEISPYRTLPCTLKIGPNGVNYTVLQGLLDQCPEWAGKCKSDGLNKTIKLPDIDEDIGHALVHYLYTGTYHTLKGQGLLDHATTLTKYKRSVGLYCVAKRYGFSGLKKLSKYEAEIHGKDLSLAEFLDVAEVAFKKLPENEVWFTGCLEKSLEAAFEGDKSLFVKGIFLDHIGNVKRFDKALVKCMAKIYAGRDATPEEPLCGVEEAAEVLICAGGSACVEELAAAELLPYGEPAPCDEPTPCDEPVFYDEPFSWEKLILYDEPVSWEKLTPCKEALPCEEDSPQGAKDHFGRPSATVFPFSYHKTNFTNVPVRSAHTPSTSDLTEGSSAYTSKKGKKDKKGKKIATLECSLRAKHLQDDDLLKECSSCYAFVEGVAARVMGGGI